MPFRDATLASRPLTLASSSGKAVMLFAAKTPKYHANRQSRPSTNEGISVAKVPLALAAAWRFAAVSDCASPTTQIKSGYSP